MCQASVLFISPWNEIIWTFQYPTRRLMGGINSATIFDDDKYIETQQRNIKMTRKLFYTRHFVYCKIILQVICDIHIIL